MVLRVVGLDEAQEIDYLGLDHRCALFSGVHYPDRSQLVQTSCVKMWHEAEDEGLDLVTDYVDNERAFTYILSFSSYKHSMKKRKKIHAPKKRKKKIIKISTSIADHDLMVKSNHINKFIQAGNPVEIVILSAERNYDDGSVEHIKSYLKENVENAVFQDKANGMIVTFHKNG